MSSPSVPSSPESYIEDDTYMPSELQQFYAFHNQRVRVENNYDNSPTNNSSSPDYIIVDYELTPSVMGLFTSFESMGLREELLESIYQFGIRKPTTLQQKGIMPILNGMDVCAQVHSGSGKTATFVIAMLQSLNTCLRETQVLVLTPSDESATEVQDAVLALGEEMRAQCHVCIEGTTKEADLKALTYGQHIVSGIPGAILEMINKGVLRTQSIKMLIIDGPDIMVSDGRKKQIYELFSCLPEAKQVAIFSATWPDEVIKMEKKFIKNQVNLLVGPEDPGLEFLWDTEHTEVEEKDPEFEFDMLRYMWNIEQVVIFCDDKKKVVSLAGTLQASQVATNFIHGDMAQDERDRILNEHKSGKSRVLVSTFDCERLIQVDQQPLVVNYELPTNHQFFMFRYGRPARFGPNGVSVEFADEDSILPPDETDEEIFEFDDI